MILAYKKMCLRKRFKDSVRGWCKVFEVTYNWQTREFHPHFHIMLAVDKNYFISENYIKQDEYCRLWQDCLKVNYKPIVDVRVFKESEKGRGKEIAEVAKYTIKSSHIMANLTGLSAYSQEIQDEVRTLTDKMTDEIVLRLDSALENRRLIEFGGAIKAKRKQLKLDDVNDDNADLVHTEVEEGIQKNLHYEIERYRWHIGYKDYVRLEDNEPTQDESNQKSADGQ
jgi:plasmid rolling circle replication initiator protein Rep